MEADVVHRADMGVVERGGGPGFPIEAFERFGMATILRQELERDVTSKAQVLGLVDDSHPARPDGLQDPVVGNRLSDERRSLEARIHRTAMIATFGERAPRPPRFRLRGSIP